MLNRLNLSCTATQAAAPHSCHWQLKALHFHSQQPGPGLGMGQHQSTDPAIPTGQSKAVTVFLGRIHLSAGLLKGFWVPCYQGEGSQTLIPKGRDKAPHVAALPGSESLQPPQPAPLEPWSACSPIPGAEGWREESQLHRDLPEKGSGDGDKTALDMLGLTDPYAECTRAVGKEQFLQKPLPWLFWGRLC